MALRKPRFRYTYMGLFSVLVILGLILGDPDQGLITDLPFGATTAATVLLLSRAVLYITLFHLSRKGLFDYVDMKVLFDQARDGNQAAAIGIVGIAIMCLSIALLIYAAVN